MLNNLRRPPLRQKTNMTSIVIRALVVTVALTAILLEFESLSGKAQAVTH